jgi:hypothetical protein
VSASSKALVLRACENIPLGRTTEGKSGAGQVARMI